MLVPAFSCHVSVKCEFSMACFQTFYEYRKDSVLLVICFYPFVETVYTHQLMCVTLKLLLF